MYPIHHSTLKIEQAERHAEAARLRLAASAGGRRRWWSIRPVLAVDPGSPAPMPTPATPVTAPATSPAPAAVRIADDDRVLVGP